MVVEIDFYKETNFKDTKIGKVPKDWDVKPYTDFAGYINGYGFNPSEWKKEGLPIIRIQNLNGSEDYNYNDKDLGEDYKVRNGNLLFSWSATIDIFKWNKGDAWLNQHIFKVLPKKGIDKDFLYYAIKNYLRKIKSHIHGSTMKHFKKGELRTNFLPKTKEDEQKKIVEVVRDFDKNLFEVQKEINYLQKIKTKIMEILFSKGLRGEPLKNTSIGMIPKSWEVVELGKIANIIMGQSPPSSAYNDSEGTPFLQGNAEFGSRNPKETKYTKKITKLSKKGSVLLSVRAPIGAVNMSDKEYCIGRGLCSISLKTDDNGYLFYLLNHLRPQLERIGEGSTFKAVKRDHIKRLLVPNPYKQEREEIDKILFDIDKLLEIKENKKSKLEKIFNYTTDQLLTGRIRVK